MVGIDLGTTFSCVAVWDDNRAEVIQNSMGNRTTPSWVSFDGKNVLVGEAARSKSMRAPKTSIYDAKRMIGRKFTDPNVQHSIAMWPFSVTEHRQNCAVSLPIEGKERVLMPEEVSAYVLAKMKHTAEDKLGCPICRAVITVPAYFNDAQRQATIDASMIAGLKVERIINEPTAAALAYGMERSTREVSDKPKTILVYDLGGGTLDVTVLIIDGGVFEVKSTSGDTHLGGQDFDNNLVEYFLPIVEREVGENVKLNSKSMKKLRDACQKLKHDLSHSDQATLEVDINGEDFDSELSREKFVEINRDLFGRCLQPIDRAITDSGISREAVDEIVLIGGSTRIARIQEMLEEYFPNKKLSKKINPDEAVAMGAAIQGANLSLTFDQKHPKLVDITLMDVTPMSLGIELVGGKMSILIPRNTTIPYSHTRTYRNNEDYQTKAVVEVFEGEDKRTKNNRLLGRFTLPGLPQKLRGQVSIPVTFKIDVNGVLEVTACVQGDEGRSKSLVIQKDKGLLSEAEIKSKAKLVSQWEETNRAKKVN